MRLDPRESRDTQLVHERRERRTLRPAGQHSVEALHVESAEELRPGPAALYERESWVGCERVLGRVKASAARAALLLKPQRPASENSVTSSSPARSRSRAGASPARFARTKPRCAK